MQTAVQLEQRTHGDNFNEKIFCKFQENTTIQKWEIVEFYIRQIIVVKFIYSEKATKFCKIFTLLLSSVAPVKSKVKILQNFEAFSEYMNFKIVLELLSFVHYKINIWSTN